MLATPPADGHNWGTGSFPSLGLAYLAAGIRTFPDLDVRCVDGFAEGLTSKEATRRALALSPDMLGVSVTSNNIERGIRFLRQVRRARPGMRTIMGGHHATVFDELLLNEVPELDMILRGEADDSFPELCRRMLAFEDLAGVPGLSHRKDGRLVRGEPQHVEDLDRLPFPDRTIFDYRGYGRQWAGFPLPDLPPLATLVSSRGCPYHCAFCAKTTPQLARYRVRRAETVFQELLEASRMGYRLAAFVDENFTGDAGRLRDLCGLILDHGLTMRFAFQGSLHHLPEDTLRLMHRAGFDVAMVGIESGSDGQLRRFNKPANRRALAAGVRRAKKAHMAVIAYFITGGPGETAEDHEASKAFVRDVRPHICQTGELSVSPGSRIWERLIGAVLSEETVKASRTRMIHTLPGQPSGAQIALRIRDFHRAFGRSWLDRRRIPEVADLYLRNGFFRIAVNRLPLLVTRLFPRRPDAA